MARVSAGACLLAAAVACGCGTHARVYRTDAGVARVDAWSDDDRPARGDVRPVWSFAFPPIVDAARVPAEGFTAASVGGEPIARDDLRGSIGWGRKDGGLQIRLQRRIGPHWVPLSVNGDYRIDATILLPATSGREGD